jgi:LacI family transcriptional regulator
VGLLVPSMAWLWISEVMQGVADAAEAAGYGLLLYTLNRGEQSMTQFASQVSRAAFDGLLAIEPPGTLRYLKDLHASGVPVVLIDDRAYHPDLPSVVTTHRQGGYSAGAHLLDAGRRNLAVVSGPGEFGCSRDRLGRASCCARERLRMSPSAR